MASAEQPTTMWQTYARAGISAVKDGRYPAAELFFQLALREAETGDDQDPRLSMSRLLLNDVYFEEGKTDLSRQYSNIPSIKIERLGPQFLDVADSFESMGWRCYNKAKTKLQEADSEKAEDARKSLESDSQILYHRTQRYFLLVWGIRQHALGDLAPTVITSRAQLGLVCVRLGDYDQAAEYLEKAASDLEELARRETESQQNNLRHSVLSPRAKAAAMWATDILVLPDGTDLPTLYFLVGRNYFEAANGTLPDCRHAVENGKGATDSTCKATEQRLTHAVHYVARSAISWQRVWPQHPIAGNTFDYLAQVFETFPKLYRLEGKGQQADALQVQLDRIEAKSGEPVRRDLGAFAELLRLTGDGHEASSLREAALGSDQGGN
jgi:tetratricopeptide (TPR) repeat protein